MTGTACQIPMKPNPRRLDPVNYPDHFDIPTRFSDVDSQQHLNNVRLMEYYQEGRLLFHHALRSKFSLGREAGGRILVAHHAVDYLREVTYPGVIRLCMGVLRIGTSSYTLGSALFQNERCAGLALTVMVNGSDTGAAPIPAALADALRSKSIPADAH